LAEREAEIARLRAENEELRALQSRVLAVQRNPAIKAERATAVAVTFACASAESRAQADDEGYVPVRLASLGENAGVSADRASVHVDHLAKWGLVTKKVERTTVEVVNPETGELRHEPRSTLWVKLNAPPRETLDRLAALTPERERTWGGKRVQCPEHPDAAILHTWRCAECGRVLREETLESEDPSDPQDASPSPPAPATCTTRSIGRQDASSSVAGSTRKTLASDSPSLGVGDRVRVGDGAAIRPSEPTTLGAVFADSGGRRWARLGSRGTLARIEDDGGVSERPPPDGAGCQVCPGGWASERPESADPSDDPVGEETITWTG
jgi:hypothetical protein